MTVARVITLSSFHYTLSVNDINWNKNYSTIALTLLFITPNWSNVTVYGKLTIIKISLKVNNSLMKNHRRKCEFHLWLSKDNKNICVRHIPGVRLSLSLSLSFYFVSFVFIEKIALFFISSSIKNDGKYLTLICCSNKVEFEWPPTIIMGLKKRQLFFFFLIIFGNLAKGRILDNKSEDSETPNVDESIEKNGNSSEVVPSEIETSPRDKIESETLNRDEIETEILPRDEKANEINSNVEASSSPLCHQVNMFVFVFLHFNKVLGCKIT